MMPALPSGMAGITRFQDLVAWQRALEVNDLVCELTETGKAARDLEFKAQIRTAAAKVGPLIAEGFVRFTDPEFVRYLRMARAEMAEVQAHLEQGARRGYYTDEQRSRCWPPTAPWARSPTCSRRSWRSASNPPPSPIGARNGDGRTNRRPPVTCR